MHDRTAMDHTKSEIHDCCDEKAEHCLLSGSDVYDTRSTATNFTHTEPSLPSYAAVPATLQDL